MKNIKMDKKRLGVSVYPELQDIEKIKDYLTLAAKYGFNRVFTSLLQVTLENKQEAINKMKEVIDHANLLGYESIVDVSPKVFKLLNIELPNLKFFADLGASTIRMDLHENGHIEKLISENPYGINLEINMSSFKHLGSLLREVNVDKNKVIASHNFYPQRYSGLSYNYFLEITKHYKKLGYKTSAFITSQSGQVGPWPINEGLPTLEMHRDLPIKTQAKHFFALGMIDDVVIGNAFASEDELKDLSELNPNKLELDIEVTSKDMSDVEEKIVFEYDKHFRRGDINEYMIRSTMTRVIYKGKTIPAHSITNKQLPGEVYVGNNDFLNYKGECHIILKEMPAEPKKNKIGNIVEHEKFLIQFIDSWGSFTLKRKDK